MKEKERKLRRFAPCSICDVERLESWLTDMAAQGWHLKEVTFRQQLFVFTKGAPQTVRYRLEAGKRWHDGDKPEYTAQQLFEDCGWKAVSSYGRFFIFRSLTPDAPELNTDPAVQLMSMKWLRRRVVIDTLVMLLTVAVALALMRFRVFQYLTVAGLSPLILLIAAFLTAAVEFAENFWRANAFVKRLKTNDPLDHSKPWKKGALYHQATTAICTAALILFYTGWISLSLVSCVYQITDRGPYQGDPPFVTLSDLCDGSGYSYQAAQADPVWSEITTSAAYTLEWTEYFTVTDPEGESYSGYFQLIYHETSAEWIAKGLAAEYLREGQREIIEQEWTLPELDVDFAAVYWNRVIIIRDGSTVVKAYVPMIDGSSDLAELWVQKMADMLKEHS